MPRIPFPSPSEVPAELTAFLAPLPQDPVLKEMTHSPATAKPFIALGTTMYTRLSLPPRLRELAILTVANDCQSDYVFAQHEPMAELVGVTAEEREEIRRPSPGTDLFDDLDKAVMAFALETIREPRVSDTVFDRVRASVGEKGIIELLQLCGYYLTFSRISTTLELEIEVHGAGVLEKIKAVKID